MESRETSTEKRAFQRRPVELSVRFRSEMLDFEAKAELLGEIQDISDGGLFVKSEFLEIPGTQVSLILWLPGDSHPRVVKGVVAWVAEGAPKGPGMGIRLVQPIAA